MRLEELYKLFLQSDGVSIDTRTIRPKQLFFGLKGRTFDGNRKAEEALEKGASYSIVDDISVVSSKNIILVESVLKTLQELANFHRSKIKVPVLGITGSNGKTTTKELIREVLSTRYKVACTVGNYNNHIGLPLTLLNEPRDADIWILEMGTNAPGNIQELCDIGNPNLGLITNIGLAHLEQLINQEGIYKEKTALFDSVRDSNGIIFINKEDDCLLQYKREENSIPYTSTQIGEIEIITRNGSEDYLELELRKGKDVLEIKSYLTGKYNVENIASAIAVGKYFSIPLNTICNAVSSYKPSNMRSQLRRTDKNMLFIDAYNANPSSMLESIVSHLARQKASLLFILGDMLELGADAIDYHESVLMKLESEEVEVITVGPIFSLCSNKIEQRFDSVESLINSNLLCVVQDKQILIKGSRGIQLEKVLPFL